MHLFKLAITSVLLGITASVLVSDPDFNSLWERFKARHAKRYEGDDEGRRRHIWEDRLRLIHEHNLEADLGEHTYRLGLNQFTDWTREEYRKFLTGFRRDRSWGTEDEEQQSGEESVTVGAGSASELPTEVNWVKNGWVTKVKNQGKCGSCYTFAATGALEAQLYNKTKQLVTLSEQNLVDCSKSYGNMGCNGGVTDYAFRYVKEQGIQPEDSYPYVGTDTDACKFDSTKSVTKASGWVNIPRGNELALQQAVATAGPVAVAIDADPISFQLYRSGVYQNSACSPTEITHAVLAVGYGVENGNEYWLIKNSWGERWGDDGYIKIARNMNNMCGITTQASYPKI
jgi:cathepsin L